jgi:hypothetical protein
MQMKKFSESGLPLKRSGHGLTIHPGDQNTRRFNKPHVLLGGALCNGTRQLAESAGLHDHAGFFDPHERTIEQFLIIISLVGFFFAVNPFKNAKVPVQVKNPQSR